jgi:hypothetical protein
MKILSAMVFLWCPSHRFLDHKQKKKPSLLISNEHEPALVRPDSLDVRCDHLEERIPFLGTVVAESEWADRLLRFPMEHEPEQLERTPRHDMHDPR